MFGEYALSNRWVLSMRVKWDRTFEDRTSGGREFQSFGATWGKLRSPYHTKRTWVVVSRFGLRDSLLVCR